MGSKIKSNYHFSAEGEVDPDYARLFNYLEANDLAVLYSHRNSLDQLIYNSMYTINPEVNAH